MVFLKKAVLLSLASLSATVNAAAATIPRGDVDARNYGYNVCARSDVAVLLRLFASKYYVLGNQICPKLLHAPPPGTATVTKTCTKTGSTTTTVTSSVTVKAGTSVVPVLATTTRSSVETDTVTTTVVATSYATYIETDMTTTTTTVTAPGSTITTTVTTASLLNKRNQPCLGEIYPGLPREVSVIDRDVALLVCECFYKPPPQKTVTVDKTATVYKTATARVTKATTVPATTQYSTYVDTVLATSTATVVSDVVSVTTSTLSSTVTQTSVTTVTFTGSPTTDVVYSTVSYSQVPLPSNNCIYNEYYDEPTVNDDPTDNYAAGIEECQALCTAQPECQFWFFFHYDPTKDRGFDSASCILDNEAYNPNYLQCGYVDNFNVAYNKISPGGN